MEDPRGGGGDRPPPTTHSIIPTAPLATPQIAPTAPVAASDLHPQPEPEPESALSRLIRTQKQIVYEQWEDLKSSLPVHILPDPISGQSVAVGLLEDTQSGEVIHVKLEQEELIYEEVLSYVSYFVDPSRSRIGHLYEDLLQRVAEIDAQIAQFMNSERHSSMSYVWLKSVSWLERERREILPVIREQETRKRRTYSDVRIPMVQKRQRRNREAQRSLRQLLNRGSINPATVATTTTTTEEEEEEEELAWSLVALSADAPPPPYLRQIQHRSNGEEEEEEDEEPWPVRDDGAEREGISYLLQSATLNDDDDDDQRAPPRSTDEWEQVSAADPTTAPQTQGDILAPDEGTRPEQLHASPSDILSYAPISEPLPLSSSSSSLLPFPSPPSLPLPSPPPSLPPQPQVEPAQMQRDETGSTVSDSPVDSQEERLNRMEQRDFTGVASPSADPVLTFDLTEVPEDEPIEYIDFHSL